MAYPYPQPPQGMMAPIRPLLMPAQPYQVQGAPEEQFVPGAGGQGGQGMLQGLMKPPGAGGAPGAAGSANPAAAGASGASGAAGAAGGFGDFMAQLGPLLAFFGG